MKKIVIASLIALAGSAFAASVTLEGQNQIGDHGAANSTNSQVTVRGSLNNMFTADVGVTQYVAAGTHALSTRDEAGLTLSLPAGPVGIYTRVAVGDKYTNTTHFGYYSVEPGVTYSIGKATAKVGFRFRDAFQESNLDATRTTRAGLSYALTNKDSVGIRFDRVTGDSTNHSYNLSYTRSF